MFRYGKAAPGPFFPFGTGWYHPEKRLQAEETLAMSCDETFLFFEMAWLLYEFCIYWDLKA